MRQVLVLRIHADGALVLAELVGSQGSLEGVVVTVVTGHLQRFNTEDLFVALLVETNVDFLQSDGIVESLFVDDILDVVGDPEKLGKEVGQDEANQKTTFVTLLGVDGAKKLAEEYTGKALAALDGCDKTVYAREATQYLLSRDF